uniref:Uncharacterized protein n=1 Tax=Anguilla anguilla TaxID=7936 RepID=A0A0E9TCB6_ANGAN
MLRCLLLYSSNLSRFLPGLRW